MTILSSILLESSPNPHIQGRLWRSFMDGSLLFFLSDIHFQLCVSCNCVGSLGDGSRSAFFGLNLLLLCLLPGVGVGEASSLFRSLTGEFRQVFYHVCNFKMFSAIMWIAFSFFNDSLWRIKFPFDDMSDYLFIIFLFALLMVRNHCLNKLTEICIFVFIFSEDLWFSFYI